MVRRIVAVVLLVVVTFIATLSYTMANMTIHVCDDVITMEIFGNVWEHGITE